jgi:hypothetical protein
MAAIIASRDAAGLPASGAILPSVAAAALNLRSRGAVRDAIYARDGVRSLRNRIGQSNGRGCSLGEFM